MISPHKTPALAKMAMLLLFAIAAVAILDTTSISAQELGRTITSPFGIARQPSASESGSEGDTFVDPETGEVGHIIRNPFGQANPDGVDTGIDIPDDAGEEVGGIITSPFGVPDPDGVDTGMDVIDEDEEYLISLPDDEESEDVEDNEDVDEVDDETSDDVKELEEESYETPTEKYVPVKDNPIPNREWDDFYIVGTCGSNSVTSSTDDPGENETLFVPAGISFTVQAFSSTGDWPNGSPIWLTQNLNGNRLMEDKYVFNETVAGDYIIRVIYNASQKVVRVKVYETLLYKYGNNSTYVQMKDYNNDGEYDLFIPYYEIVQTKKDEILHGSTPPSLTISLKINQDYIQSSGSSNTLVWKVANVVVAPTPSNASELELILGEPAYKKIEIFLNNTRVIVAHIYIIKVIYEESDNYNHYGFDKPTHYDYNEDYKTYVSLERKDPNISMEDCPSTNVKITVEPFPLNHDIFIKPSNIHTKINSKNEDKLNQSVCEFEIKSLSTDLRSTTEISIVIKNKTLPNDFILISNDLSVKIYKKEIFDISLFRFRTNESLNKGVINDYFKQIVYKLNNISEEQFPAVFAPDVNNNSCIDYYDGNNNPEVSRITSAVGVYVNPVVLVNNLSLNYRATIENANISKIIINTASFLGFEDFFDINIEEGGSRLFLGGSSIRFVGYNGFYYRYEILDPPLALSQGQYSDIYLTSYQLSGLTLPNDVVLINTSHQKNDKIAVHELAHFIARLHDTDYREYQSQETIMQFDGINNELCNFFSCRYAVIVHSFAGGASGDFESHWDNAIRNADPIQNLTPTSN